VHLCPLAIIEIGQKTSGARFELFQKTTISTNCCFILLFNFVVLCSRLPFDIFEKFRFFRTQLPLKSVIGTISFDRRDDKSRRRQKEKINVPCWVAPIHFLILSENRINIIFESCVHPLAQKCNICKQKTFKNPIGHNSVRTSSPLSIYLI
jgi:hypothetical protein